MNSDQMAHFSVNAPVPKAAPKPRAKRQPAASSGQFIDPAPPPAYLGSQQDQGDKTEKINKNHTYVGDIVRADKQKLLEKLNKRNFSQMATGRLSDAVQFY